MKGGKVFTDKIAKEEFGKDMKKDTKNTKKDTKKDTISTFISNETTKEIVHLFANSQQIQEYSNFLNETFPVDNTVRLKPISYYLGKGKTL